MLTPDQWGVLYRALLDAQTYAAVQLRREPVAAIVPYLQAEYDRATAALDIVFQLPVDWNQREEQAA